LLNVVLILFARIVDVQARVTRDSKWFKGVRAEFQRYMGANETRGSELLELCQSIKAAALIVDSKVSDDDLDGQTKQVDAMESLCQSLRKFQSLMGSFSSLRPGGMSKPCELFVASALRTYYNHLPKTADEVDNANMCCDIAKRIGATTLSQTITEFLMGLSRTNAKVQLDQAVKLDMENMENVKTLLVAYRVSQNAMTDIQFRELRERIKDIMEGVAKFVHRADLAENIMTEQLADAKACLLALAADAKVVGDGVDDGLTANNVTIFNEVVGKIHVFKSRMAATEMSLVGGDTISIGETCTKLLAATVAIQSLTSTKKPTWSGNAQRAGDPMVDAMGDHLRKALGMLEAYGRGAVSSALDKLSTRIDHLTLVAGGAADGARWSADLTDDSEKPDILDAFNIYLKDINADDIMTRREDLIMVPLTRISTCLQ
jgi:hypothetical protein